MHSEVNTSRVPSLHSPHEGRDIVGQFLNGKVTVFSSRTLLMSGGRLRGMTLISSSKETKGKVVPVVSYR